MNKILLILVVIVCVVLTACNNSENSTNEVVITNEVAKPSNIPDLSEIPYEADLPDNVGIIANNAYYRILQFTNPPNFDKGVSEVYYQKGFSESRLVYIYSLGQNAEYSTVYRFGFLDENFNPITEPLFERAGNFERECAIVEIEGKWGVISKDGTFILECKFDDTPVISDLMISVKVEANDKDRTFNYYDKYSSNKLLFSIEKVFNSNLQRYETYKITQDGTREQVFLIDGWDSARIKPFYDESAKLWGYFDGEGEMVIQPIYQAASSFVESRAIVKIDGKYGFIDEYGDLVVEAIYDKVYPFNDGIARVRLKGKYGYVSQRGGEIIQCKYLWANDFCDSLAAVRDKNGGYIYINEEDETVISGDYKNIGSFSHGYAPVQDNESGMYYYIDQRGNHAFSNMYFTHADEFDSHGYALAYEQFHIEYEDIEGGMYNTGTENIYIIYVKRPL